MAAVGMWAMGWLDRDLKVIGDDLVTGARKYLGIERTVPDAPPPMDILRSRRPQPQASEALTTDDDEQGDQTDRITLNHQKRGALVGRVTVVDGDTIQMQGRSIRLWGIDAPEAGQLCAGQHRQWRCGTEAANALQDYIRQYLVACYDKGEDIHGRMLGQCFVGHIDLNGWLVENGWAFAYRHYTLEYISRESRAKFRKRGVWVVRNPTRPWDWRKAH